MEMTMKKASINVDRISELPDPLIHQILSSIDMREVITTSLLSKRWRYIWKSTPFLNFSVKWKREMDFVDSTLYLRDATPMCKFSVECGEELDAFRIFTWVICALKRNPSELYVEGNYLDRFIEVPEQLFTSGVTVLRLAIRVKVPGSICVAPNVTRLSLDGVLLPCGNPNGVLVMTCPNLKHLSLRNCQEGHLREFVIATPQLLSLCLIDGRNTSDCRINISCPTLKLINHEGCLYKDYVLQNLSGLVTTKLSLDIKAQEDSELLLKVLTGIGNVNSLILKIWWKSGGNFQDKLQVFPNLKFLELTARISVCGVANFLERLPNIVKLVWNRCDDDEKDDEWESYSPMMSELCYLKAVQIRGAKGNNAEVKFLQILLAKAVVLEELVMETNQEHAEFAERLLNLPRASSKVAIRYWTQMN